MQGKFSLLKVCVLGRNVVMVNGQGAWSECKRSQVQIPVTSHCPGWLFKDTVCAIENTFILLSNQPFAVQSIK